MSGCSCEEYTHKGDCDYCQGFHHGKEYLLEKIIKELKMFGAYWEVPQEGPMSGDFEWVEFRDHQLYKDIIASIELISEK